MTTEPSPGCLHDTTVAAFAIRDELSCNYRLIGTPPPYKTRRAYLPSIVIMLSRRNVCMTEDLIDDILNVPGNRSYEAAPGIFVTWIEPA